MHDHPHWEHEAGVMAVVALGATEQILTIVSTIRNDLASSAFVVDFPVARLAGTHALVARAAGATKGTAVEWLAQHHGITPAEVVVVGYPRLYAQDGPCPGGPGSDRRAMLNEAADALTQVIASRAAAAGFTFADARPAFAGHEICTDDAWIDAFHVHPTATGHARGYLPLVATTAP